MYSEVDNGKGIIRTTWNKVRSKAYAVNAELTKIIDEISPNKDYPIYLVYYPYGANSSDDISPFIPDQYGDLYRLNDNKINKKIISELGYAANSAPLALLLDKNIEVFMDTLQSQRTSIPVMKYKPGDIFPLSAILQTTNSKNYAPNNILKATSGTRSSFLLPKINVQAKFDHLIRDFRVKCDKPNSYYDHYHIFKDLCQIPLISNNWKSCLIYFTYPWIKKISHDPAWEKLRLYLYQYDWNNMLFNRNHIYFDFIFSVLQASLKFKPSPYFADTAKYLFKIAIGEAFGYQPCTTNDDLPLEGLQKAFTSSYGIDYSPTIMTTTRANNKNQKPIYYSLQYPTMNAFSYRSRKTTSALYELSELCELIEAYKKQIVLNSDMLKSNELMNTINTKNFIFIHNMPQAKKKIVNSKDIVMQDSQFLDKNGLKINTDAKFFRGCIKVL